VNREGNPLLANTNPSLAYDQLGLEVGQLSGKNVRFRGFFLVDRLRLTGFNPNDTGAFHNAIVYRKVIQ